MIPVIFINCDSYPFVQWIMAGVKLYETRNRNTLKRFIGQTVYIAETSHKHKPIVKCRATITAATDIRNKTVYDCLRNRTRIEKGSIYDWKPETRVKWLYKLENVEPVPEFIPEGIRHGYTWMECGTGGIIA